MSSRDQEIEIGLLPVPAVLFPGGQLRLIAAKAYHQDLIRDCLREGQGLGLVLAEATRWKSFVRAARRDARSKPP